LQGHGDQADQAADHRWQGGLPGRHSHPLGYKGLGDGRREEERTPINMLSPTVIDPNAYTPEFKGFLVNIEKVS